MNRAFLIVAAMVLCRGHGGRAWAQATFTSGDTATLDSIAKAKEAQRAKDIESLHRLVNRVKERGYASIQDSSSLEMLMGQVIQDRVLGLTAAQRQKLVKGAIGEDDYSALEQILMRQLGSAESARREPALALLGYPLFALEAVDQLKTLVFDNDRRNQLFAVKALVCLDAPGANHLLDNVVISGILNDLDAASAINALYISNDQDLDSIAMALAKMNPGPATFLSLLPILKKSPDYRRIIGEAFQNGAFRVPDKDQLTLGELGNLNVEDALLNEIFRAPASYLTDGAVKKRVLMYAETSRHFQLYTMALLVLEKSGQELEYFTNMQKDNQLPAEKKRVLEKIVSRIQKGERLK